VKRAMVTGVSSGIGNATAKALLKDGWQVLGVSRTQPLLKHEQFRWAQTDVAIGYRVDQLSRFMEGDSLDALVHAAAVQGPVGKLSKVDAIEWAGTVRANLIGAFHVVRLALPYLRASDDGRIVLFSGGGAFGPRPNYSAYAASKAGVVALMETLAEEEASVTVNCVAPGFVPTPIHAASLEAGAGVIGMDEFQKISAVMTDDDGEALRRAVSCVLHLLSDATKGLTGKTISAEHDDWGAIGPLNVEGLNDSPVWTRSRLPASKPAALV
jgi:NAD(P)-dependent dehydrogenase (short-subunit alcohol dehydrogenase family)